MTSSSVNVTNIDTAKLSQWIYCDAFQEDSVHIQCDACSETFFKGRDWDAGKEDWLGTAISHFIEKHLAEFT